MSEQTLEDLEEVIKKDDREMINQKFDDIDQIIKKYDPFDSSRRESRDKVESLILRRTFSAIATLEVTDHSVGIEVMYEYMKFYEDKIRGGA